jgi:hypothetical protein
VGVSPQAECICAPCTPCTALRVGTALHPVPAHHGHPKSCRSPTSAWINRVTFVQGLRVAAMARGRAGGCLGPPHLLGARERTCDDTRSAAAIAARLRPPLPRRGWAKAWLSADVRVRICATAAARRPARRSIYNRRCAGPTRPAVALRQPRTAPRPRRCMRRRAPLLWGAPGPAGVTPPQRGAPPCAPGTCAWGVAARASGCITVTGATSAGSDPPQCVPHGALGPWWASARADAGRQRRRGPPRPRPHMRPDAATRAFCAWRAAGRVRPCTRVPWGSLLQWSKPRL